MRNQSLAFYHALSRLLPHSFVGKLLAVTFVGTYVPLLSLLIYVLVNSNFTGMRWEVFVIAFIATMIGAALSVYAIRLLIAPLALSSRSLHDYVNDGRVPALPTRYKDLAGRLLSDVQYAIEHVEQLHQALNKTAMSDFLTGAYSRLAGAERLQSDIARAIRGEGEFSLAFIDVDNLKEINDRHGHHTGDQCLKRLADTINAKLRKGDWIARWGGDEFVLLLWNIDTSAAADVLLRLDKVLDREAITSDSGEPVRLRMSAGICQYQSDLDRDALLRCADRALYRAKSNGKGNVVTFDGNRYTRMV